MHFTCMYIHRKVSWDKIPGPTFAPNEGECSEIAASNGLGAPRGSINGCVNKRAEFGSSFFSYGEASALERLLRELQFRGWCFDPVPHLCSISSTAAPSRREHHGSGLSAMGTFPVGAAQGNRPFPGEANGTSRCPCSSRAQISTPKPNLYINLYAIYGYRRGSERCTERACISPQQSKQLMKTDLGSTRP